MVKVELLDPFEVARRVCPEWRVRIRRADPVHGDIAVDLDIADQGVSALQIDARPMDDRPDLHRQQAGTFTRPEVFGRHEALCSLPQQRKNGLAALSDQHGFDAFHVNRRQCFVTARRIQSRQACHLAAGLGQFAGCDEPRALSEASGTLCRQGCLGLVDGVVVRIDVAFVEPEFLEKRRPPGDRGATFL